jgi:heat shock protein HtpX
MLQTVGLRTHIWNNALKSVLLLAGFPILLLLICFAFALLIAAMDNPDFADGVAQALSLMPALVPVAVIGALIWFAIAYVANQWIVDSLTGARILTRQEDPRTWNLLENLAISRGLKMPTLRVIETPALNAYASGIREGRYSVTVTRGLLDTLDDAELEAVLAHELTHIRNRDVQLLVISAVFVGIISLAADVMARGFRFGSYGAGRRSGGWGSSGSGGDSKKGGGGAVLLIVAAILIFILARVLAIALRFALSRRREYMADAGAVELTKNPDAMVAALRKIEGHSAIGAPAQIREMFFDNSEKVGFDAMFATHPSIEARVKALVEHAGARDVTPPALPDGSVPSVPLPEAETTDRPNSGIADGPRPIGTWG